MSRLLRLPSMMGSDNVPSESLSSFSLSGYVADVSSATVLTPSVTVRNSANSPLAGKTVSYNLAVCTVDVSVSVASAFPSEIANDGIDEATITLQIKDAQTGAGIPDIGTSNISVVSSRTATITADTASTDSSGVIRYTMTSADAGTHTLTITVDGVVLDDHPAVVVTGTPADPSWPNEPGYSLLAEWVDESTTTATGVRNEDIPGFIAVDETHLGTLTFSAGGHTITASNGATPWATNGISVGMMLRFTGTASNNAYFAITGISGQVATVRETTVSETATVFDCVSGWGDKSVVTSGPTGTPTIGGTHFIRTYYPGGVHGGHDAGRVVIDFVGTETAIFAAFEAQWASDNPVSTSSGGNKHLIINFSGGSRFIVNFDEGAAAGNWSIYGGTTGSSDWGTSTGAYTLGAWTIVELQLVKPTGPSTTDGILRLWVDDVLVLERTNLQYGGSVGSDFPAGNFSNATWDASNNGNHTADHPSGQRYIGVDAGTEDQESISWLSAFYVSTP